MTTTTTNAGDAELEKTLSRGDRKRRFKEIQAAKQQDPSQAAGNRTETGEALVKRLKNSALLPLDTSAPFRHRRCIIEYDGTNFNGFQAQENRHTMRTVQETIEHAIARTTGETVRVKGCSRTDKGVHARGQVVVFASKCTSQDRVFRDAINTRLPDDVVCRTLETLPPFGPTATAEGEDADEGDAGFDPRSNSIGKIYEYKIVSSSLRPVLDRHHVWLLNKPLDILKMRQAAAQLCSARAEAAAATEAKDFSAFTPAKSSKLNEKEKGVNGNFCTLFSIEIHQEEHEEKEKEDAMQKILLRFHGDRFLYKMVRNLVGTLVDVGLGKRAPDSMSALIASKDRAQAGQGAPPHGLTLVRVLYK